MGIWNAGSQRRGSQPLPPDTSGQAELGPRPGEVSWRKPRASLPRRECQAEPPHPASDGSNPVGGGPPSRAQWEMGAAGLYSHPVHPSAPLHSRRQRKGGSSGLTWRCVTNHGREGTSGLEDETVGGPPH